MYRCTDVGISLTLNPVRECVWALKIACLSLGNQDLLSSFYSHHSAFTGNQATDASMGLSLSHYSAFLLRRNQYVAFKVEILRGRCLVKGTRPGENISLNLVLWGVYTRNVKLVHFAKTCRKLHICPPFSGKKRVNLPFGARFSIKWQSASPHHSVHFTRFVQDLWPEILVSFKNSFRELPFRLLHLVYSLNELQLSQNSFIMIILKQINWVSWFEWVRRLEHHCHVNSQSLTGTGTWNSQWLGLSPVVSRNRVWFGCLSCLGTRLSNYPKELHSLFKLLVLQSCFTIQTD